MENEQCNGIYDNCIGFCIVGFLFYTCTIILHSFDHFFGHDLKCLVIGWAKHFNTIFQVGKKRRIKKVHKRKCTAYVFLTCASLREAERQREKERKECKRRIKTFGVISCIFAKFYDHFKVSIVLQPGDAIGRITQHGALFTIVTLASTHAFLCICIVFSSSAFHDWEWRIA